MNFHPLAFAERFLDFANNRNAGSGRNLFDERRIIWDVGVDDDLHVLHAAAIIDLKKREILF